MTSIQEKIDDVGSEGVFWLGMRISAYIGIAFALVFNVWIVESFLTSDGRLEWPHTLHVWLIQGAALIAGILMLLVYVNHRHIKIWLQKITPASQAGILLSFLVIIEIFLGVGFWLSAEHPGFSDWGYLYNLFHLDIEYNIPTLFSVGQLWFAAILAFLCFLRSKVVANNVRQDKIAWISAAAVMLLLGLDELLSFHENSATLLFASGILDDQLYSRLSGYGYAWTLLGLSLALVFGTWFFWRFYAVFRQKKRYLIMLVIAALVFLTGSLFMENLQVYVKDHYQMAKAPRVMLLAEEMLEMFGVSLTIYVFFLHLQEMKKISA